MYCEKDRVFKTNPLSGIGFCDPSSTERILLKKCKKCELLLGIIFEISMVCVCKVCSVPYNKPEMFTSHFFASPSRVSSL